MRPTTILLSVLLLTTACGDDLVDPVEVTHGDLINAPKTAAVVFSSGAGTFKTLTRTGVVPFLPSGGPSMATHAVLGGFLHGTSEAYFEAGFVGYRVCVPGSCSQVWKTFVDFVPASWVVSTAMTIASGDTVSVTVAVDPANPFLGQASFFNHTRGTSLLMTANKPAASPYFGDRAAVMVERLGNDGLANFGTMQATWSATTTSGTPMAIFSNKDMFSNNGTPMVSSTAPSANVAQFQWLSAGP